MKEGKVVAQGSYDEITSTGFNIKDILDTYNQSMKKKDNKADEAKFTKEKIGPPKEFGKPIEKFDDKKSQAISIKSTWCPEDELKGPKKGKDLTFAEKRKTGNITF